ncbi:MAG: glycosyltransferase family 4 protein [Candidatus Paceibacterota bacterium]
MKLIYITSKKFPSRKTDPFYVQSMAEAFSRLRGEDFLFFMRGNVPDEFKEIQTSSISTPRRFRVFFYFIALPILVFVRKWNTKEVAFLSYDPYLLSILIFWRSIFRFKYIICSDWHQMFDDWRDSYVSKHSDYLITTSKRLKGLISSACNIDPEKILVAYGGVNPAPFIEQSKEDKEGRRVRLGLPTDTFLVGYVGAFRSIGTMEKGLDTMIQALPYVEGPIRMVFVGGSKQQIDEYKKLASSIGVLGKCIFVEKQPFKNVIAYELSMDVLVIPYPDKHHFREYGFPMKVWEYMASGRSIVYSNLEIIKEVLGGRGTSFQPDNLQSLARSILTVYQNFSSAEDIACENPKAISAYTWEARAKSIVSFIEK